jgi:hypothetical protein
MSQQTFPLPLGSSLRWGAQQAIRLREEGFGEAVLDAVQPLFTAYARTGEEAHIKQAYRLLAGDR